MSGSLANHYNLFPVGILQHGKVGVWPGCVNSAGILGALSDCRGRERALEQLLCSSCVNCAVTGFVPCVLQEGSHTENSVVQAHINRLINISRSQLFC